MKEKKSSIGCLFWIALILLILVIFLFNRSTIQRVLENTGFLEILTQEDVEPDVERIEENSREDIENREPEVQIEPQTQVPAQSEQPKPETEESVEVAPVPVEEEPEVESIGLLPENENATDPQLRKSRLYFVRVDDAGHISLKGIMRPVYYTDSPLTETLTNLLKGLSTTEINEGLLSLIPEGTDLLSVSVKNSTAYLNFSDNFLFNAWGVEGFSGQLEQIVFTATEFSTVERVQVLINGEKQDYMGIEGGPYIGEPLSRDSF